MKILSKNSKFILGSTAIAVVLSSASAFSADSVADGAAYIHSSAGTVSISGDTYKAHTTGVSGRAWGVLVHSGSILNVSATSVETTGSKAHGIQVGQFGGSNATGEDASKVHLNNGVTVATEGDDSFGLHAIDGGTIDGSATITTKGKNGFGAFAESWSEIALSGATIETAGQNAFGIIANNDRNATAGKISAIDSKITTEGAGASGAYADNGGSASLTNTDIATSGAQAHAVQALTGASIDVVGGSITTTGESAYGALANNTGEITVDGTIITSGKRAYGLLAMNGGTITSTADITTKGDTAHTVQAGGNGSNSEPLGATAGTVNLNAGTITFEGTNWGTALHAVDEGVINAENVDVVSNSYGAIAETASTINIENSTVTTTGNVSALIANNDRKKSGKDATAVGGTLNVTDTAVKTSGNNAAGVSAEQGGTIVVSGGSITTTGENSYGAIATDGGKATVDGTITTSGKRAYGLLAMNGGTITSTADITTTGNTAHTVQAGGNGSNAEPLGDTAGTVILNAGKITFEGTNWGTALHAVDKGIIEAKDIEVRSNSYGAIAETASIINISNSTVATTGNVSALIANNDRAKNGIDANADGGTLNVTNTVVTTTGDNAAGVSAEHGGMITVTGGSITTTGANASAVAVIGSGTVEVTGTTLSSAKAATVGVKLTKTGDVANIKFGDGTVATTNNGTLLLVERNVADLGGIVNFTLEAGSVSSGNIVDEKATATGYTNFVVQENATWTGSVKGIKDLVAQAGSNLNFDAGTAILGSLSGVNSDFVFDLTGGSIGTDLKLNSGSTTKGGSIDAPITVGGDVEIDGTSQFGGNWQIAGDLTSAGTITPGNSIGVVSIDGNLNLDETSVYEVEINSDGESDRINVGGTAYLAGKVNVTPLGGYQLGTAYIILTANSFAGTEFKGVTFSENLLFVTPDLKYTGQDPDGEDSGAEDGNSAQFTVMAEPEVIAPNRTVELTLNRSNVAFSSVAATSNQAATADALDSLSLSNSPLMSSVALLDASNARSAFEQLSGDNYASNKTGLVETARLTADAINDRLRNAFEGVAASNVPVLSYAKTPKSAGAQAIDGATAAQPSANYAVWATGFGSWIDHSGNSDAGGLKTSVGGFMSGVDLGLASGWRLGVAGGYSQTDLDGKNRSSSAKSDNWHLGIYGGNQWDALGLRLGLVQTWHKIDSSRSVAYSGFDDSLSADYNGRTLQAFGELGYRIDTASAAFEPFANLSHVRLRTNGFTEQGGDAALTVDKDTTNTTFSTLGLRASAPVTFGATNAKLTGTLGWRHAYSDITPTSQQAFAGSETFNVDGVAIAKDVAVLGAGFDVELSEISTFGLRYNGQYGNGAKQNGFNATLNVKF